MACYQLVKEHDRVGRMADTQEYENFVVDKARLSPVLLAELQREVPGKLEDLGDRIVIKHLYMERRMTPLNLYLEQANDQQMRDAIEEYGNAIKQLAAANIFPGDMLFKNFGVTRHGRVVFYDYDEICYMTEVNFRDIPPPRYPEDELASEPWYSIAPNDVFPEEFRHFLCGDRRIRQVFEELHSDLFTAEYWRGLQQRIREGHVEDVFAYRKQRFSQRSGRRCRPPPLRCKSGLGARDGGARQFGDAGVVAAFQRVRRHQPGAADAQYAFQRQVAAVVVRRDTAGRAEAHLRERAADRLQRFYAAIGFRREEFKLAQAVIHAQHQLGNGADARNKRNGPGGGRVEQLVGQPRTDGELRTGLGHFTQLLGIDHGTGADDRFRHFWAMARMASMAQAVRSVTSSTRTPPATSAFASGTACSSLLITMTGTTGPAVRICSALVFHWFMMTFSSVAAARRDAARLSIKI